MAYKRISPQPVVEGGTGAQTLTGVLTGNGTSAITANAVTEYYVLIAGASNAVSDVNPGSTAGVPLVSNGSGAPGFTTATVPGGGTGVTTLTDYAPLCGGTSSTGAIQQATSGISTSGYVLTSTGSGSLPTFQATSVPYLSITFVDSGDSPYTVLSTDQFIAVDPTGGAITIKLPNSPTPGRVIYIKDQTGEAAVHNITITTVGGSVDIDGATSFVMNTAYESASLIFDATAYEIF